MTGPPSAPLPAIEGRCDPAFAAVRDAFVQNFAERDECGAAVAVTVDGTTVVDLWGGWSDAGRTRPWERDTLVDVFSVGKGMAALAVLQLIDGGALAPDDPVARTWPAFAAAGKESITVRQLLSHQAGLPGLRGRLADRAIYDWDLMTSSLAAEVPWWEPGTAHGYHVNTFGFLAGELVRRTAGVPFAEWFATRVARPLGADFHFGTRPADDARTAEYQFPAGATPTPAFPADEGAAPSRHDLIYANPPTFSGLGVVNTRAWRGAVHPSTNGHANARAVARIYGALALGGTLDGVRLVGPAALARATLEEAAGQDLVLERPSRFGLGFQLTQPERPLGRGPGSFGHFGAGGSLGFADPDARLSFGYTMNRFGHRWQDPRNQALRDAVYDAL